MEKPILTMSGVTKRFPGLTALSGVNFRLFSGEIHALMGQNGAGKSTLIKVLTGVYPIDEGEIRLEGRPIRAHNPLEAQLAGISTVYQEVNLCPNLTVAENILLGREPRRRGRIDWKEMNRQAEQLLARLEVQLDVTQPLSAYSVAVQQLVAIARALGISAKVLILDEPTSSLDANEVNQLFRVMKRLKADGLAILFVTHFLDQVYEVTDRMTVLRNGELIGEFLTAELPKFELVSKMIGKDLEDLDGIPSTAGHPNSGAAAEPLLEAAGLARKGSMEPFDLSIHRGEVVSLAGLLGSGRTEIARLLFGADRADRGELRWRGGRTTIASPRHAIGAGMAFCSENRKTEGIIEDLTVRENIILAMQSLRGWYRSIPRRKQAEIADEYIAMLNIYPPQPEQLIKNLSGGNQQKVLLARWLLTDPDLLILDEPTRGIDIGAKTEIQKLIVSLYQRGMSILFISSELEEVLRCSKRIAVLRDRRKIAEMPNDGIGEQDIMKAIAGG